MSDMDHVIREALAQGWQHDRTTRGHHQFYAPDGKGVVTTSGTPSDHRSFRNFMSEMKKRGFVMGIKRIKYGAARREILEYLKRHEGQEVTRDTLKVYLRSVLPGIAELTILKNLRAAETIEGVTNTALGMIYRTKTEPPKAVAPTISKDDEERELDEALEALAKVERIIRRHKEIAKFLAEIMK